MRITGITALLAGACLGLQLSSHAATITSDTPFYSAPAVQIGTIKEGAEVTILGKVDELTRVSVKSGALQVNGFVSSDAIDDKASSSSTTSSSTKVDDVTGKFSAIVKTQYHSAGRATADFTIVINTRQKQIKRPTVYAMTLARDRNTKSLWVSKDFMLQETDNTARHWEAPEAVSRKQRTIDLKALKFANIRGAVMPELKKDEMMASRMELWYDGRLLDVWNSDTDSSLRTKKIPTDWYTRKTGMISDK